MFLQMTLFLFFHAWVMLRGGDVASPVSVRLCPCGSFISGLSDCVSCCAPWCTCFSDSGALGVCSQEWGCGVLMHFHFYLKVPFHVGFPKAVTNDIPPAWKRGPSYLNPTAAFLECRLFHSGLFAFNKVVRHCHLDFQCLMICLIV